jgi:hypothetical protein
VVIFVLGFTQRRRRLKEIRRGELWYSYSRGQSWLAPFIALRPDLVQRIADPLAAFVGAFVVVYVSKLLALWFLWAALCLAIMEAIIADKILNRMLDAMDSLLLGEVQHADYMYLRKHQNEGERQAATNAAAQARGFATNPDADDIQRSIERRRRREIEGGMGEQEGVA